MRGFGFAAEASAASAASRAYARAGAAVVSCGGDNLGHAWLDGLNPWMADLLLAHPKGAPPLAALPPLPARPGATCVLGPVSDTPPDALVCPASATPGCQYMCQGPPQNKRLHRGRPGARSARSEGAGSAEALRGGARAACRA